MRQYPILGLRPVYDVLRSRDLLAEWTGRAIRHFAFPKGNHRAALRELVRELGFRSATILGERTAERSGNHFALPRISVGRYDSKARFRLRMAGI